MKSETVYYRKPQKVEAFKWEGNSDIAGWIKANVTYDRCNEQWTEINVDCPLDPYPAFELKTVRQEIRLETMTPRGDNCNYFIEQGDWLVNDNGQFAVLTDEAFQDEYFAVEFKAVGPKLEELL